jgi:hypothetical protein
MLHSGHQQQHSKVVSQPDHKYRQPVSGMKTPHEILQAVHGPVDFPALTRQWQVRWQLHIEPDSSKGRIRRAQNIL